MAVGELFDPINGMIRLGLLMVLLIVVFALSRWKNIDIERELGIAAIRGFCQLMILSLILTAIFDLENLLLVLIVLAVMLTAAGLTSAKRATGIPNMFPITTSSILIGSTISVSVMILVGIIPLKPEFLIPLGGMAIGNSMISCSLTVNRLKAEFKNNRNSM